MKLRCRLEFHNFTMWSETKDVQRFRADAFTGIRIANSEFVTHEQERRCQDCRVIETRTVRR